jgi:hypothetical protein
MKIFFGVILAASAIVSSCLFCSCSKSDTKVFKKTPFPLSKLALIGDANPGNISERVILYCTLDKEAKFKEIYRLNATARKGDKIIPYASSTPVIKNGAGSKKFYASTMNNLYEFSGINPLAPPKMFSLKDFKFTQKKNFFSNFFVFQNKIYMEVGYFEENQRKLYELDLSSIPSTATYKPDMYLDFDSEHPNCGNIVKIETKKAPRLNLGDNNHYLYTPNGKEVIPYSPFSPKINNNLKNLGCVDFSPEYGWIFSKKNKLNSSIPNDIIYVENGLDLNRGTSLAGTTMRDGVCYHADGKKLFPDKYSIISKGFLAHWGCDGQIYYLRDNQLCRYSKEKKKEEIIYQWSKRCEITEFPIFSLNRQILVILAYSGKSTSMYIFNLKKETYSIVQAPKSFSNAIIITGETKDNL